MKKYAIVVLAVFILTGCGGADKAPSSPAVSSEATPVEKNAAVKTVDASTTGSFKGRVTFEGNVPVAAEISMRGNPECATLHPGGKTLSQEVLVKDGGLENVFVYVKEGLEGYSFSAPTTPAIVSNQKCMYVPHVSGAQVGQEVQLFNEDQTLHNVHSYSKVNKSWNIGLPFAGMKQTKKFESPEIMVSLKCDVHPWMTGFIGVLAHPYFSVSGENGAFEIQNLPPGDYVIEAWHEKFGAQSQNIRIEPRETKETGFKYSA